MANLLYSLLIFTTLLLPSATIAANQDFSQQRKDLIAKIEEHVQATRSYIDKEIVDPRVMETMAKIPRHEFVPPDQVKSAYKNRPLPIGHGQTISQPFIVALMTDFLAVSSDSTVLEIGTGSGYQAAVLADLAKQVYSIEIIEPLAEKAERKFKQLGIKNIQTKTSDGYHGWKEHSPYDAIMVTAAADHVPPPLLQQLRIGGRMLIPVGSRFQTQQLLFITREAEEEFTTRQILPVMFVPLTGER